LIAITVATAIGFCLGLAENFTRICDPIIQILRPVSPLACARGPELEVTIRKALAGNGYLPSDS
jgi:hypothetical protein